MTHGGASHFQYQDSRLVLKRNKGGRLLQGRRRYIAFFRRSRLLQQSLPSADCGADEQDCDGLYPLLTSRHAHSTDDSRKYRLIRQPEA